MPKVLLVEDNEINRDMLSRRLIRRGFDILIAINFIIFNKQNFRHGKYYGEDLRNISGAEIGRAHV